MSPRITLRTEMAFVCKGCDSVVPVNSVEASVECVSCQLAIPMAPERWEDVLRLLRVDALEMAEGEERTAQHPIAEGMVRTVHARAAAACASCGTPIKDDVLTSIPASGHHPCGCGAKIAVRSIAGVHGVRAFVGEDLEGAGAAPSVTPPQDVKCPHCGGALRADGSTRVVRCVFCRRDVLLPDEAWARLKPARQVRVFYIVLDEGARPIGVGFHFNEARAAAADGQGNLYVLGRLPARPEAAAPITSGDTKVEEAVWSYDAELRLRWVRFLPRDYAGMTVMPGGATLLLYDDEMCTLDAATGDAVDDDAGFGISMEANATLHADADGTFLYVRHGNAKRFAKDGAPAQVFPEQSVGFWGHLMLDSIKMVVPALHAGIMPNGDVAVVTLRTTANDDGTAVLMEPWVGRYDRTGKELYCQNTRFTDYDLRSPIQGDDTDGAYVLAGGNVWRNSPGDCRCVPGMGAVGAFLVLPEGDVWLFCGYGAIRRARRLTDGTHEIHFANAIARDREAAARREEEEESE